MVMALIRRVVAIAGGVAAAREYARRNPDKVNRMATKAGDFVDRRTNGRYHDKIDKAVTKVRAATEPKR
jgi:antitoxin protein of toxin-antitoxin system